MTHQNPLQNHRKLCDELYQLALEENRFLKEQGRVPSAELIERKQQLLARLDESLAALRSMPRDEAASAENHEAAEQTKTRILQFLHLDRENEQLLLRHSLAPRPPPAVPLAGATHLQRAYQQGGMNPPGS
jgi:ElaB/YqjD/DUF883 family membrane-anchored ribosome-binding protein